MLDSDSVRKVGERLKLAFDCLVNRTAPGTQAFSDVSIFQLCYVLRKAAESHGRIFADVLAEVPSVGAGQTSNRPFGNSTSSEQPTEKQQQRQSWTHNAQPTTLVLDGGTPRG